MSSIPTLGALTVVESEKADVSGGSASPQRRRGRSFSPPLKRRRCRIAASVSAPPIYQRGLWGRSFQRRSSKAVGIPGDLPAPAVFQSGLVLTPGSVGSILGRLGTLVRSDCEEVSHVRMSALFWDQRRIILDLPDNAAFRLLRVRHESVSDPCFMEVEDLWKRLQDTISTLKPSMKEIWSRSSSS